MGRTSFMKNVNENVTKEEKAGFNLPDYYAKLFENSQEFWKKGFDEWQKQMQSAGPFSNMGGNFDFSLVDYYKNMTTTSQDFWKKVGESQKTYAALVELWRQLAERSAALDQKGVIEVCEKWSKEYANVLRNNLVPNVSDPIKELSQELINYFEVSGVTMMENIKNYMDSGETLQQATQQAMQKALAGSPNAYVDFMEALKKSYEESFGRMTHHPMFGKDMEFWRRHRDSFDRFVKYNMAATEFYTAMYEVIRESTRKVIEDYVAMLGSDGQSQNFDEFYKYWAKQVSLAYDNVLFSEQYGQLAGNMVDEMSKFKLAYDELCESYLSYLPIAKKSDMDALHKTVYELKKEVQSLKKEIKGNEK